MALNTSHLWALYQKHLTRRAVVEPLWQDLARFEFPDRMTTLGVASPGESLTDELLDSTAVFSAQVLAASLQAGLTNQAIKWFGLRPTDRNLLASDEVQLWLEDTNMRMLDAFSSSNFGAESSEMYRDLGVFGNAALFVGENPKQGPVVSGNSFRGLRFEAVPVGAFTIDEDGNGRVNKFFYRVRLSVGAVADRWGAQNLSEEAQKLNKENPVTEIWMLCFVSPRGYISGLKARLPFTSVWMEEKTKHIVNESGYRTFPFAVPRWAKTGGQVYGNGPGMVALPEVKGLNKTIELTLKSLAIAVQPPLKSRLNSVIGSVDVSAGGLTILRNMNDLEELVTRADFAAGDLKIQDMRQSIRRIFYVDQLLQLLSRETPQMTATEVVAKMQLLREIVGPAFVRLESEFLNPVIDRVFDIMLRAGAFLPVPAELRNAEISVDYESPIGLAKRSNELTAIDRVLIRAQELATIGRADVLDRLNADDILKKTSEISGAPKTILLTDEETSAVRTQRETREAAQGTLSALQQGSEVARNLAPLAKVAQEAGAE